MDHVEDLTPSELRFSWLPNATVDRLVPRNLLSIAVLTCFVRHTESYGMTLTKLVKAAAGRGRGISEADISRAYNVLIEERFLVRVEFTYQLPEGGRPRRYTWHGISRVGLTEEQFKDIVRRHTPGKKVLVDLEGGEVRRVKVLAAEIYCHLGPMKIDREGLLVPNERARGGRRKQATTRPQPQPHRRQSVAPDVPAEEATPQANVEPGNTSSTLTCENDLFPQVDVELVHVESTSSSSNKKIGKEDQTEHRGHAAAASGRRKLLPDALPSKTAGRSDTRVTEPGKLVGDHSPARAREEHSGHEHDQVDEQQGDQVAEELAGLSAEEIRAWIRRRVLHKGHPGRSPLEPPILAAESV